MSSLSDRHDFVVCLFLFLPLDSFQLCSSFHAVGSNAAVHNITILQYCCAHYLPTTAIKSKWHAIDGDGGDPHFFFLLFGCCFFC